jgi:phage N-6-adenine-methyltransferase
MNDDIYPPLGSLPIDKQILNLIGPTIKRGKSRQDYETPWSFIKAVEAKFGPIAFDLAADSENFKGPEGMYFDVQNDAFRHDWSKITGNLWLNPPYGTIGPWAKKASEGGRVLLLTPASVGSNWFADYVHGKAHVYFLRPRLVFEGADDPYPKDLILSVFAEPPGYTPWKWI